MGDQPGTVAVDGRPLLREVQRLATSGARAVEVFEADGLMLAVPQLALDVPGAAAHMNGGSSDTDLLLWRWTGAGFEPGGTLPCPGGEDAEHFEIDGAHYLACASARRGAGPYDGNVDTVVWRLEAGSWTEAQRLPGFFAKQVRRFDLKGRRFLGLALGVTVPGHEIRNPDQSMILEWTGSTWAPFQTLDGRWGYNFLGMEIEGRAFLAYADHVGPSPLYELTPEGFVERQVLAAAGGRAFAKLDIDGAPHLLVATIAGDVTSFRWDGAAFAPVQTLCTDGGREFALFQARGTTWLLLVRFIEGSPKAPVTAIDSRLYRLDGAAWSLAAAIPTHGATDAAAFAADGRLWLIVAQSLTPDIRFAQPSTLYEIVDEAR